MHFRSLHMKGQRAFLTYEVSTKITVIFVNFYRSEINPRKPASPKSSTAEYNESSLSYLLFLSER